MFITETLTASDPRKTTKSVKSLLAPIALHASDAVNAVALTRHLIARQIAAGADRRTGARRAAVRSQIKISVTTSSVAFSSFDAAFARTRAGLVARRIDGELRVAVARIARGVIEKRSGASVALLSAKILLAHALAGC